MTVIRPSSISGINSITANGGDINLFRADGTKADVPIVNNITAGVVTATKFVGSGADLTGIDAGTLKHNNNTKAQATASGVTITGNLGVSGVLTYEDVTNIDSVGIITARSAVSIADSIIHTGDTNTSLRFPAADTITAETGGVERARITSGGEFQIQHFSPPDGSSAARAARSALEIKRHYPQKTSGNYYIKDSSGTARQIYCEMETDGGGWMLWTDFNTSQTSMMEALGGNAADPDAGSGTLLARSNYNNYAYYTVWIKASQIDAAGERLHSFVTLDANGAIKYIADYGSDFLYEEVGDPYDPTKNEYFDNTGSGKTEYIKNTGAYTPQLGVSSGWATFSGDGNSQVYIREMDTRINPGDHRSLHLVERIYNFDSSGVPFWIVAESMHPTPHWSDFSLIQGEAADGQNPNIQTHNVEINSMNGNNGPSIRARSRGVLTGTFEYTFQLGYNWGWSIGSLNSAIGIENSLKAANTDPYSAYTQPYYHASLYNNNSNNNWYVTSKTPWASEVNQTFSPGINYGNHVLWRETDGTIKARDTSGTHSYNFPTKFAGPLIMCSGSQSPHYTKLQSVWNTTNSDTALNGRNRWYK